jgi:hypothetical protein
MRPERERLRLAEVAGWQSMKKGVLARWSRLKREQAERKDSPPLEEAAAGAPLPAASDAGADAQEEFNTVRLQDLPDIETLTYESDFSAFMAKGVPKAIRNQALKKLWRSNPVLANSRRPERLRSRLPAVRDPGARRARGRGSRTRHQVADRARPRPQAAGSGTIGPGTTGRGTTDGALDARRRDAAGRSGRRPAAPRPRVLRHGREPPSRGPHGRNRP